MVILFPSIPTFLNKITYTHNQIVFFDNPSAQSTNSKKISGALFLLSNSLLPLNTAYSYPSTSILIKSTFLILLTINKESKVIVSIFSLSLVNTEDNDPLPNNSTGLKKLTISPSTSAIALLISIQLLMLLLCWLNSRYLKILGDASIQIALISFLVFRIGKAIVPMFAPMSIIKPFAGI